jgi:cytochrome b
MNSRARGMADNSLVTVWDPLVRLFHWVLAAAFTIAFIAGEDWLAVHTLAGYMIFALVIFRVVWGGIGTPYARFRNFVRPWREALAYLSALSVRRAPRYLGHNPAGGAMIVILLISLLITTLSGMMLYGLGDASGPFAGLAPHAGFLWVDVAEAVHEFFANFTLLLVGVHVLGVAVGSLAHRENLIRAMIDGRKRAPAADASHQI